MKTGTRFQKSKGAVAFSPFLKLRRQALLRKGWDSEPRVSKLTLEVPPFVQSEMQKIRTKRFFSRIGERVQEPRRGLSTTHSVKKPDAVEEGCSCAIRRVGF